MGWGDAGKWGSKPAPCCASKPELEEYAISVRGYVHVKAKSPEDAVAMAKEAMAEGTATPNWEYSV